MALDPELEVLKARLFKELDRVVGALDGLTDAQARWQPTESASSVLSLAAHAIGSTLVIVTLAGGEGRRDRDAEFLEPGDPTHVRARAEAVKAKVAAAFDAIDPAVLGDRAPSQRAGQAGRPAKVPAVWSGRLAANTVRDVLLTRVTHVAEHAGHAELTRDLALRSTPGS